MPEDDLIIGPEETPEEPFSPEDIVWDETTNCTYIETAVEALESLSEIDFATYTELEKKQVKKTKRMLIRIIHHYTKEIFDEMVTEDKSEVE